MTPHVHGTRAAAQPLEYMPQLDSLRALAVAGVFVAHFVSVSDPIAGFAPWGDLGVRLFFVLSGYLITGILLTCRARLGRGRFSPWVAIRNFYIRRFLRLFPLYALYVTAALLLLPRSREHIAWFATYTVNWLFAFHFEAIGTMTHFWTLAIEEQFYLTWPWLVLFSPRRLLLPAILAIVLLGPIFRIVMVLVGVSTAAISMMTPSHLDTLGMGGLLAVLASSDGKGRLHAARLMQLGLWLGAPLMVVYLVCEHGHAYPRLGMILGETAAGLFFAWVVGRAAGGIGGAVGAVLTAAPLIYLGRISYGLYVIHYHVPGVMREKILPRMGLSVLHSDWLNCLLFAGVTILLAALSWRFMESPINELKRYFPYSARKPASVPQTRQAGEAEPSAPGTPLPAQDGS